MSSSLYNSPTYAFKAFTDEQWRAYQSVRRRWPAPIDWDEARLLLEQACREFSEVETQREQRRRSKEYKVALDRAARALGTLRATLRELEELSPSGNDLEGLPDLVIVEEKLGLLRSEYETWSTPFGGRKNRNRERLDNRLLSIWEEQFHGRLRSSKGQSDTPTGPLVRFLLLTYRTLLGKRAPGPSGIRSVIEKAKKRWRGTSKRGGGSQ